ncbi:MULTISPECIES: D-alanine--D-alanine ligase [unclassified Vibrio]|uniref:D-alanine--D-alanine ligase n=1 Tax=unclassified Vibrio TaxID=2614977 RepID=UPI001361E597|nr:MULTISPECIES: D-alanine--D-alanine ligase [unclassified Vibrio]NAW58143.1 D-alanine--D-alanine ligase [Vibrio sp. V36_P2S2PM302]NAX25342.1 D-alanine--D-alanine ligase [Vibrio sp. V38_P2S17PM301]NAX30596.1 D-alanine--D-alanine ligase [Vibrio sp. V37_P2S8PM304]
MLMPDIPCIEPNRINAGMPILELDTGRTVSPYEFLPSWFFYTPVVMQSLLQGVRYLDWTLPLIANPTIRLSGMVGESKHDILNLAGSHAKRWIAPFVTLTKDTRSIDDQLQAALHAMQSAQLAFPVVAKPDLGCRGVGVKLVQDDMQLRHYIESFPDHARYLIQQKAPYQAEAGVFYVRYPGQQRGRIFSMTLKYAPSVIGDGKHTLKRLIERCPRAGQLTHLYFPRYPDKLDWVPKKGEEFQLAFAGSHSRGSIFRNGNQFITEELTRQLDKIFDDFDSFHFGRLDIKFEDIHQFMRGERFMILEINGASSEAAHIWDRNTPLREIFSTLLAQYRMLFDIGAQQKQRGHQTPALKELFHAWREEKQLTQQYPATD